MFIVVTYDITDDKRRDQISSELQNYGIRVQKSIFECHLDYNQIETLKASLEIMIDATTDNVRFYYLCKKDHGKTAVEGVQLIYRDDDYFMI